MSPRPQPEATPGAYLKSAAAKAAYGFKPRPRHGDSVSESGERQGGGGALIACCLGTKWSSPIEFLGQRGPATCVVEREDLFLGTDGIPVRECDVEISDLYDPIRCSVSDPATAGAAQGAAVERWKAPTGPTNHRSVGLNTKLPPSPGCGNIHWSGVGWVKTSVQVAPS